ncbi:MAG TPA: hypothetical protein VGV92_08345 [Gammaproteobacteria bacterium]|nr:hypothetical protein [Gammaproteobacteria bacterium]
MSELLARGHAKRALLETIKVHVRDPENRKALLELCHLLNTSNGDHADFERKLQLLNSWVEATIKGNPDKYAVEYPIHNNYDITIYGGSIDVRALIHHHKKRPHLSGETDNKKWLRHPITDAKLLPEDVERIQQLCTKNLLADEILINENGTVEVRSRMQGTPYGLLTNIGDNQLFGNAASAMANNRPAPAAENNQQLPQYPRLGRGN